MQQPLLIERFPTPAERRMPLDREPARRLADWGNRITTNNIIAEWNPPGQCEVHCALPWPGIAFVERLARGRLSYASDRMRPSTLRVGGFKTLPPHCTYRALWDTGWYGVILFNPEFLAQLTTDAGPAIDAGILPVLIEQDLQLAHLCSLYKAAFMREEGHSLLYVESIAALIGARLLSHGSGRAKAVAPSARNRARREVALALDYIESGLDRTLSLAEIASVAGIGIYHFARCFKSALGQSPHQYVMGRRIDRVRELLATTNLPIAEIAYATGFSSQSHMTDTFRRLLGTTPGRFRRDVSL